MDDICLIGTRGKQPAIKTTRQDSLFTGKHSEIAMRSETCVEPAQSGIFYAGKIVSAFSLVETIYHVRKLVYQRSTDH